VRSLLADIHGTSADVSVVSLNGAAIASLKVPYEPA